MNTLGGTVTQEGLSPYVAVGGDPPEDPYVLGSSSPQEPHTVQSFLAPGVGVCASSSWAGMRRTRTTRMSCPPVSGT